MESGNIVAKPVRGWLHCDQMIAKQGITYSVRVSKSTAAFNLKFMSVYSVYWLLASQHFDEKSGF